MSAASSIAVSEVQGVHLHLKSLLANYPALTQDADDACWNMLSQAKLVSFDAHSILFHEAMECKHLMLIVEGKVRVYKNSPEGREVTLYRVEPGEL
jgi:CRP/FNR family transcriptional regulator